MSQSTIPINYEERLQLSSVEVDTKQISFSTVTLESDRFIACRQDESLIIVDLQSPSQPTKRPNTAESTIMNPQAKVIALRAKGGTTMQIFNLELKSRMKDAEMSEPVIFWRWVNVNTIGLVTETSVYHWSMEGNSGPTKMFARDDRLSGTSIINYRVDHTGKWAFVVGIKAVEGQVQGTIQLYSVDAGKSQVMDGHAAAFAKYTPDGSDKAATVFAFAARTDYNADGKLYLLEVGGDKENPAFQKRIVDLPFKGSDPDFPMSMQASSKYDVLYVITKAGYLHLFHLETGTLIYMNRISQDTIFATTQDTANGGVLGINRKGQVLSISVNEQNIVPFVTNQLGNVKLAIRLASRNGFPGAEELFYRQFNELFNRGDYVAAAKVAATSPNGALRNSQTIGRFAMLPTPPGGGRSPLIQYFVTLLEYGKLNALESVELAKPVLQQGRQQLLENWIKEDKLTPSEELGDLVRQVDGQLALSIYLRASVPHKVVQAFAENGQYDKIPVYAQRVGYKPDYIYLLQALCARNPADAVKFAQSLVNAETGESQVDVMQAADVFFQRNLVEQATTFVLEAVKTDSAEFGPLQTRTLEANLLTAPNVAGAILSNKMWSHFDKPRVAQLCEQAGKFENALELYTDMFDIKRVMQHAPQIRQDFLVDYFGNLSADDALELLREMLQSNLRANLQVVINIATKYSEEITQGDPKVIVRLFEQFNSWDGLYFYLGSIVHKSEDPDVHFKYIEAAVKCQQFKEVERIVRESNVFDPVKVKDFLKMQRLPDQLPLIIVCDRFDMIDDLTKYLHQNGMLRFIEVYVQRVNPMRTPQVVGALLDVDADENFIQSLIQSVRNTCPTQELVDAVEERNRLKLLLPWLEARVNEGSKDPAVHNAMAKVFIETNNNPKHFLETNPYYDSKVVGAYCEKRNATLAFVAYKRGRCNFELVDVTNKNSMFKEQARYLVESQDLELWAHVLNPENKWRRKLIDQVIQTALPESRNADFISTTVKAFMTANLPKELIELLDKIVLDDNSQFRDNSNLQNLLILTAIKATDERVMEYIQRLENYDGPAIANIAAQANMFEEAFTIYDKFNQRVDATKVLIEMIKDLDRGTTYAEKINEPEVWSVLAKARLRAGEVPLAINAFIKANDPLLFREVTTVSEREGYFEDLVRYLEMCRRKTQDAYIDTELVYALAKCNRLADMEELIASPTLAQIPMVAERCFEEELNEAAKILFNASNNHARLAITLVRLNQYPQAVEAAKKANSIRTWKEVMKACVQAKEFKLAQICGLNIVIHADELEDLIRYYETLGYFEQLMALMEAALGLERAHMGVFTELAILYSKYNSKKLMEHLKLFWSRLNISKCIEECRNSAHWAELTFLHIQYGEPDSAAAVMMDHSEAWDHLTFKNVIGKVSQLEICYRAIRFYLDEQPMLLVDLLSTISSRVDQARVVAIVQADKNLSLIKPYLESVQDQNLKAVNEAINSLLIEEENYQDLRKSIDAYNNFDHVALARKLQEHELLEMRRISSYLYKNEGRFRDSVELSKKDRLFKDAMETANASGDPDLAEELLRYFVKEKNWECFAACLYTCYELVRPDVALELAWRHQVIDFVMPYMIQLLREYSQKVDLLIKERDERNKELKAVEQDPAAQQFVPQAIPMLAYTPFNAPPPGPPMGMPPMGPGPMGPMGGAPFRPF